MIHRIGEKEGGAGFPTHATLPMHSLYIVIKVLNAPDQHVEILRDKGRKYTRESRKLPRHTAMVGPVGNFDHQTHNFDFWIGPENV